MSNLLKPPETVRGLLSLDRKQFEKPITLGYLHINNIKLTNVIPIIKKHCLKMERFKPIENIAEYEYCIYLNPANITSWQNLPEDVRTDLNGLTIDENNFKQKEVTLTFDNYHTDDILKAVLPPDEEGMSSFTKIGHIVHVNLREHLLPYKKIIGEVLLDKVTACRTVVNKVNMIDNTYRNFKMEILEGDDDMMTTVKENGCKFEFDFSKVYWNSRLCTEHERIVKLVKPGDVLFDVFAGVGPFALPCAKKKCVVFANDLNPESFNWMNHNRKINKISDESCQTFNSDGRDFILNVLKPNLLKFIDKTNVYVTMNLPALAVEFLNAFVNLYAKENVQVTKMIRPPIVYVYCFAKGSEPEAIARQLVNENIGFDISDKILEVFRVRTVSSNKEMMRVAFKLDRDILLGNVSGKRKFSEDGANSDNNLNKKLNHGEEQEEAK